MIAQNGTVPPDAVRVTPTERLENGLKTLVPMHAPAPVARVDRAGVVTAAYVAVASATLAVGSLVAGVPLLSIGVLAIAAFGAGVAGMVRWGAIAGPSVAPETIAAPAARATYRNMLVGLVDVERAVADAPHLRTTLLPLLERCRAVVDLAGRMAQQTNALQHYLDTHLTAYVRSEVDRLSASSTAAADEQTRDALKRAADARAHQVTTSGEIANRRDWVQAQLELVDATLGSVAATIVKLQAEDAHERTRDDDTVASHLGQIEDQVTALESALGPELAA